MNINNIIYNHMDKNVGFTNKRTIGPIKFGISRPTLSKWLGRQATIDDIFKLHKTTAYKIYYNKYIKEERIGELRKEIQPIILAISLMDWLKVSIIILQNSLNIINSDKAIIPNGILNTKTIEAINRLPIDKVDILINTIIKLKLDMEKNKFNNNQYSKDEFNDIINYFLKFKTN